MYRLSGAVIVVVLSRSLPAEDIGRYYFALSFAEVFIVLASFRLNPVLMRRVAAQPAHASSHFASVLGFLLVSSPIYLLVVGGAALTFAPTLGWLIFLISVFTLLEHHYLFCSHLFLALRKVVYGVSIGATVQVVFLAVFLAGMWWKPSLDVFVGANLFRAVCLLGAGLFVIHRWLLPLRLGWDQSLIKEGAPFILLALLAILRNHLDTLLIGSFLDYALVGQYNLALRIVVTTYFVPHVVSQV